MSAMGQKQTWGLTIRHVRKGVQGGHCGSMHGLIVSLSEHGARKLRIQINGSAR